MTEMLSKKRCTPPHSSSIFRWDTCVERFAWFFKEQGSPQDKIETEQTTTEDDVLIKSIPRNYDFKPPKNPIVLCHGLSGFDTLILLPSFNQFTKLIANAISFERSEYFFEPEADNQWASHPALLEINYWIGIKERLEEKGCTVITSKVPSFGSIEERAITLNNFIEKETLKLKKSKTKDEVYIGKGAKQQEFQKDDKIKVNLIAHSMGGLDCRFMISRIPKRNFQVCSLTTIATPHHGSEMADYLVNNYEELRQKIPLQQSERILPRCFYELTTSYMNYFNLMTPNDPDVTYFSYGCYFNAKWYNSLYPSWKVIHDAAPNVHNDGMVTVPSCKWGHYMGTLYNMDHLDIINWRNRVKFKMNKLISPSESQTEPQIDVLDFYLHIADTLSKKGF